MRAGLPSYSPWPIIFRMKHFDAYESDLLAGLASISAGYPFRSKIDVLPEGEVAFIQMRNADPETGIDWGGLSRIELPRAARRLHA